MQLTKDFLNKLSLAEILTVLFFVSVGISMFYKYGFYSELGIGWYIDNLAPQQLFISSLGLVGSSFIGAGVGYFLGTKLSQKQSGILLFTIVLSVTTFQMTTGYFSSNYDLISKLYLMLMNTIIVMELVNDKQVKKSKLLNIPVKKEGAFDKIIRFILPALFIVGLVGMPYAIGVDSANAILKNKSKLNKVTLKDKTNNWLLIEINGDKVLLKQNSKKPIYKIIEYKEIESISVR
ncbi:hypothetical protein LCH18_08485 [Acinetobacter johnsonii]|uniref:hypothetical protein n=1 Tax=Acinetobacter johnsonii TaxID=40214 RepID=UPI001CCFC71D|nr:hypothetical protein [Acinetobacter johnsonii]UBQ39388.1 hypothetical protein LCH18_08485 [Acinetobacter johnsonii]